MWPRLGPVPTYGVLYLTGILTYVLVSFVIARRLKLRRRVWIAASISYLVAMTIGAKVLYDLHHGEFDLMALLTSEHYAKGGLWGGMPAYLVLAAPLVLMLDRHKRAALDLVALSLPIPWIFAKLACLFHGCCYGRASSLPWAITFPDAAAGGAPAGVPLHPTQIYELLVIVCILVVFRILRHERWKGSMILWFLVLYGLGRASIDFWRGDIDRFVHIGPLTLTQCACLAAAGVSILVLYIANVRMILRSSCSLILIGITLLPAGFDARAESGGRTDLYVVPNFHPACMGWLVKYSQERNYCLYSYLAHLDRLEKDHTYKFVFSELPHLITMMDFEPHRFAEFRQRTGEGRVELVNAFVLEPTINLSGGEALVQQGVQGLRWYKEIMGTEPRYCWMIDTVGWHEQMAQIVSGLALEAFVYCRYNPTGSKSEQNRAIHWIRSPDGTRTLALGLGHYYRNFSEVFRTTGALTQEQLQAEIESAETKSKGFPAGAPVLLLGGARDYALPFKYENYPAELIEAWNSQASDLTIRMATLSDYIDAVLMHVTSGKYDIPVVTSGSSKYGWSSFWMNAPFYKQWYRRSEHRLQSAEAMATIANLVAKTEYPSQDFANSWLLMALNMDRNLLWGVGVDGTFYDQKSWDARDRFAYVEQVCAEANKRAISELTQPDESSAVLFNPVNWTRSAPFKIRLPQGKILAEHDCQLLEDGSTILVKAPLAPFGLSSMRLQRRRLSPTSKTSLPDRIETKFYSAQIDPNTGALVSLKLKSTGREMLGGPANVLLAELQGNPHRVPQKAKRTLIDTSTNDKPFIIVTEGKLAKIVEIRSRFHGGGQLVRILRFYKDCRHIDFVTETYSIPAGTVLSVQFPLADQITEVRRGIPYGFSHGAWDRSNSALTGVTKDIIPVIRWSDYTLASGGGLALLDRGAPARELVGNTPILLLHNVCDTYYNRKVTWMNHTGKQIYEYALVIREKPWNQANIPKIAWEYNCPVIAWLGRAVPTAQSFVETSDNVIIQSLRRDDSQIELRLMECLGEAGKAAVKVRLLHTAAALSDLLGRQGQPLQGQGRYEFDIRPQQIITLRLRTEEVVPSAKALRSFNSLIPPHKRQYMRTSRDPTLLGHPPTK